MTPKLVIRCSLPWIKLGITASDFCKKTPMVPYEPQFIGEKYCVSTSYKPSRKDTQTACHSTRLEDIKVPPPTPRADLEDCLGSSTLQQKWNSYSSWLPYEVEFDLSKPPPTPRANDGPHDDCLEIDTFSWTNNVSDSDESQYEVRDETKKRFEGPHSTVEVRESIHVVASPMPPLDQDLSTVEVRESIHIVASSMPLLDQDVPRDEDVTPFHGDRTSQAEDVEPRDIAVLKSKGFREHSRYIRPFESTGNNKFAEPRRTIALTSPQPLAKKKRVQATKRSTPPADPTPCTTSSRPQGTTARKSRAAKRQLPCTTSLRPQGTPARKTCEAPPPATDPKNPCTTSSKHPASSPDDTKRRRVSTPSLHKKDPKRCHPAAEKPSGKRSVDDARRVPGQNPGTDKVKYTSGNHRLVKTLANPLSRKLMFLSALVEDDVCFGFAAATSNIYCEGSGSPFDMKTKNTMRSTARMYSGVIQRIVQRKNVLCHSVNLNDIVRFAIENNDFQERAVIVGCDFETMLSTVLRCCCRLTPLTVDLLQTTHGNHVCFHCYPKRRCAAYISKGGKYPRLYCQLHAKALAACEELLFYLPVFISMKTFDRRDIQLFTKYWPDVKEMGDLKGQNPYDFWTPLASRAMSPNRRWPGCFNTDADCFNTDADLLLRFANDYGKEARKVLNLNNPVNVVNLVQKLCTLFKEHERRVTAEHTRHPEQLWYKYK